MLLFQILADPAARLKTCLRAFNWNADVKEKVYASLAHFAVSNRKLRFCHPCWFQTTRVSGIEED